MIVDSETHKEREWWAEHKVFLTAKHSFVEEVLTMLRAVKSEGFAGVQFLKRILVILFMSILFVVVIGLIPVGHYKKGEPFKIGFVFHVLWVSIFIHLHIVSMYGTLFPNIKLGKPLAVGMGIFTVGVCCVFAILATQFYIAYFYFVWICVVLLSNTFVFAVYYFKYDKIDYRRKLRWYYNLAILFDFIITFGYILFLWIYTSFTGGVAQTVLAFLFPLYDLVLKALFSYLIYYYRFAAFSCIILFPADISGAVFWLVLLLCNTTTAQGFAAFLAGQVVIFFTHIVKNTSWYFKHLEKDKDPTLDPHILEIRYYAVNYMGVFCKIVAHGVASLMSAFFVIVIGYGYNKKYYPVIDHVSTSTLHYVIIPGLFLYFILCIVLVQINHRLSSKNNKASNVVDNLDTKVIGRKFFSAYIWIFTVNAIYGALIPLSFPLSQNGISFLTVT